MPWVPPNQAQLLSSHQQAGRGLLFIAVPHMPRVLATCILLWSDSAFWAYTILSGKSASSEPHFLSQSASIFCGTHAMKSLFESSSCSSMQTPFGWFASRSQQKQKPPKRQAAHFSETSLRNIFIPRIERLLAQGTVASPARLPGSEFIRAAPDASADYISNPKNEGSPENHVHPLKHLSM